MKILLGITLSLALSFTSFSQKSVDELVSEGIALHDAGKYKQAIKKYDEAIEVDPEHVLPKAEKALTYLAMGEFDFCFDACESAIKTDPDSDYLDNVYTTYANAMDMSGEPEKAIDIYNRGIEKFPEYYHLYFNRGVTQYGLNLVDEALKSFEDAVVYNPDHPGSHNAIAAIKRDGGKNVPALLAMCRFFTLEPTSTRAASNLPLIQKLTNGNAERTGKNSVSISLNPDMLISEGDGPQENDFRTTELIMSLSGALDFEKEFKKETPRERFLRKMNTILESLEESEEGQFGFYWEYYVPYFLEMKKEDQLETFSYIVFATDPDKKSKKWVKKNATAFDEFFTWSYGFDWE